MTRERLTITLKKDIIGFLDRFVDGARIRNRSHAIEYILAKHFLPESVKVLILTGGEGIKLRPITYEIPKALIPIHNRPLLEYTLEFLAKANLKDLIFATGHLGEKIEAHFLDGTRFGVKISYSREKEKNSGTVVPLLEARSQLEGGTFLVVYGDVLADIDYLDLLEFHKKNKGLATVALTSVDRPAEWGVASLQGNRITQFEEKPKTKVSSHLINAGVYVFDSRIFDYLSPDQRSLSGDVFPLLAQKGELLGYSFFGRWHDVGSPRAYTQALKEWR
jgi:NDP-sugar pyrophosphorylase family protein